MKLVVRRRAAAFGSKGMTGQHDSDRTQGAAPKRLSQDSILQATRPTPESGAAGFVAGSQIHLALFFTRTISLGTWDRQGILEREIALYTRLAQRGVHTHFITYGDRRDLAFEHRLPGISVHCNRWGLPRRWYRRHLVHLHRRVLSRCHLYKTNQIDGGLAAVAAARRWRRPLIARCGYLWSDFAAEQYGGDSPEAREADRVEREVFAAADRCVVTTAAMADRIAERIPSAAKSIHVIPNYVDTALFRPLENRTEEVDLLFIGRWSPQKNIPALIEAVRALPVRLRLIGGRPPIRWDGETDFPSRVEVLEPQPHHCLPELIHSAKVFVLPSLYEGHPKVLIEAMACGRPVIAADVPGIRQVVRHEHNGLLCGTDAGSIRAAIVRLLGDERLRRRLAENARRDAVALYGLDHVVNRELALIEELTKHGRNLHVA